MLESILILIAVAASLILIIAARQPAEFCIARTASIKAPAAAVFTYVNDLHKWDAWSPWAKLDPQAKNAYEGPLSGTGAVMRWAGNRNVGVGSMTIIESRPDNYIQFKLEFLKPFKATNRAEFNFEFDGENTTVTWRMTGTNDFVGKLMGLLMNCDKMVGGQFEKGLVTLKSVVEASNI